MTTKIKQLKAELKQLSLDIHQAKIVYKNCQRNGNSFSDYSVWAKSKGLTYTALACFDIDGGLKKAFRKLSLL